MARTIIPARAIIPFLVGMMLLTGVCNTLLTKYQDNQCVRNCDDPNPKKRVHFEQPVIQTLQMFIGEMGCWLVVGLMSLYNKYIAKTSTAYQPIPSADDGEGADNASIRSHTALTGGNGVDHKKDNVLQGGGFFSWRGHPHATSAAPHS